jgi:serine/threonine protein kinase
MSESSSQPSPVFPDDLPQDPGFTYTPPSMRTRTISAEHLAAAAQNASLWTLRLDSANEMSSSAENVASEPTRPARSLLESIWVRPTVTMTTPLARVASPDSERVLPEETGPKNDAEEPAKEAKKAPADAPSAPGPTYTLRRVVGRGGMGEVWEARQEALKRRVAVKTIRADTWESLKNKPAERFQARREFEQEALAAARLDHPNIVPVYDLGLAGENSPPLLAMKLVRGQSWHALLEQDFQTMDEAQLLARHLPILEDMAQAVAFAHSKGIIHRDLKPAQVMVGPFGETLLMDWGLAVQFAKLDQEDAEASFVARNGGNGESPDSEIPSIETATNPAGTPALMAPEQTHETAQRLGPWTDIYLLGGTLYYLLTGGIFPHKSDSALNAMRKAMMGEVTPPSQKAPRRRVPPELETLAMTALSKNPDERPVAAEFIAALRDYMTGATRRRESEELATQFQKDLKALQTEKSAGKLETREIYLRRGPFFDKIGRALELWPENLEARRLRAENLADHLDDEIKAGDLLLAEMHLAELRDLGAAETAGLDIPRLAKRLEEAIWLRNRKHRQRVVLAWFCALLLIGHGIGLVHFTFGQRLDNTDLERRAQVAERLVSVIRQQSEAEREMVFGFLDHLANRAQQGPETEMASIRELSAGAASSVANYFGGLDSRDWTREERLKWGNRLAEAGERLQAMGLSPEAQKLAAAALAVRKGGPGEPKKTPK